PGPRTDGTRADRHPSRGGLLPPRRNPALRPSPDARELSSAREAVPLPHPGTRTEEEGTTMRTTINSELTDALIKTRRFFTTKQSVSPDGRSLLKVGGRSGDAFYRDRWS